jgi:molybdopterin molybdotransferase
MQSETAPPTVLSYSQASDVVRSHAAQLAAVRSVPHEDAALLDAFGRVLAISVLADRDQPPFERATRDGFACRAAEIRQQPLRVAGLVRAGEMWAATLATGEALEIMTGAPVPPGADCVVMVEHTVTKDSGRDGNSVRLRDGRGIQPGENIVPRGSEAPGESLLIPAGIRLAAQHIAVAASCGYSRLKVFRQPRVAVQATGDELVEIGETPLPFQIRNSNSYSLAAQIAQCGGEPLLLPILRDDCDATRAAIGAALTGGNADLLILSGGVSMGRFDFVEEALSRLGAEFFFTGAKIQPGKPVVFGRLPRPTSGGWTYFFGLPGNPISTMVTFALFVHPVLQALAGEIGSGPRFVLAHLGADVRIKSGLTRFLPATLQARGLVPEVAATPWQGSGDMAGNARANCYLVVPGEAEEGREELKAGEIVSVLLIA